MGSPFTIHHSRFPEWASAFADERDRLVSLFGPRALRIDHHGSTAVPNLAAKPIIDIQISVRSLTALREYVALLATNGYRHVPHADDGWCPFFHRPAAGPHTHHVHLVETGSDAERRTLAFRDYLRVRADIVREYESLKRDLARRLAGGELDSMDDYAAAKTAFITSTTDAALAAGYPVTTIELPIVTRRLALRDFVDDDFAAVHEFGSDPEVTSHMFHGVRTEPDSQDYLRRCIAAQAQRPRRVWELAIVCREDGRVIGACDLTLERDEVADLGYILKRDAWHRGYATEAAHAMVNAGFAQLRLERIYAMCEAGHAASGRVLEKAGLRRIRTIAGERRAQGRWWDMELFELHRSEWKTSQS